MTIKAIIFDMDGVLIDAKEWHYEALNQALALFGHKIERHEHLEDYDGLPTKAKLKRLSLEKNLPTYLHDFINEMKQIYTMQAVYNSCRPRFAHEYALSRLKAEGYQLAVASNAIRRTVDVMMEKSGLDKYVCLTLSNQDIKKCKPHPEIYLAAMRRLKRKPQECLVLEDNENGIAAAEAAKAHLLKIKGVSDVAYDAIKDRIREIEADKQAPAKKRQKRARA